MKVIKNTKKFSWVFKKLNAFDNAVIFRVKNTKKRIFLIFLILLLLLSLSLSLSLSLLLLLHLGFGLGLGLGL